ncbi:hypothetical protein [Rickettsia endosymbiont of Aspidapion aeneum]|uniref:hypothetical protein n=1 Tax=Rickettsia endosymbiont of Aspidapion aeneum TaxID=3066247 RepID=UPI00313B99E1
MARIFDVIPTPHYVIPAQAGIQKVNMSKLNSNLLYNFTYFKYFSGFPPARE